MRCYELSDEALESPDIAVIGVAARLPGAEDVPTFWDNLSAGRESIRRLSDAELRAAGVDEATLRDPDYVKASGVMSALELFDAQFFGFSRREASVLDPQHRHFLEVCWEALESAGIVPESFDKPIGVFGGSGMNAYMPYNLFTNPDLMRQMGLFLVRHTGNDKDFLTTRVSYCLNLQGPSVNVQTACSTSLVAIHLACQSLLSGECDVALAGGVTIELPHYRGYHYQEGEILSPDGHCKPFSASSRGTVLTSGAGVVALRRLRDAVEAGDYIHAVVKGTAVNNDGARKVGYLAPSVDGQAACVVEALQVAGLSARDISYIECHGTGTYVGDPIEVTALIQAFSRSTKDAGFCGIGSVKSNIGHLDTAAGVASFIKVVEMLRHEELAATLHFDRPNPEIPFEGSPFYVIGEKTPWPRNGTPRRAGVSSLGVGGTNAHVIVEEAPRRLAPPSPRRDHPLVLSARSAASLDRAAQRLAAHLEREPGLDLSDVASTLIHGRRRFAHCRVLSAQNAAEARSLLGKADGKRVFDVVGDGEAVDIAFLFPGGGAQYPNMARTVYETEPRFRERLDACLSVASAQGIALKDVLFPAIGTEEEAARELARRTSLQFPAIVAVELAYAALLESIGVRPNVMLGHSLGEYAAAHLAGVLSLDDVFRVVICRGRLMEKVEPGGMMSVPLPAAELLPLIEGRLALAAVNGPELCVVSGENAALDSLTAALAARDVETRRLHIDVAAHSALLDPVLGEFEAELSRLRFGAPALPYLSNLTGAFVQGDDVRSPAYFVRHLRGTVRFSECLAALFAERPRCLLLEVGPGQALSSIARAHPARASRPCLSVCPHPKDKVEESAHFATTVGRLWAHGASVDWRALYGDEPRRIVPLPPTPFEHERHWVEPGKSYFRTAEAGDRVVRESDVSRWFYEPVFRESSRPVEDVRPGERWLVVADRGPLSDAVALELAARSVTPLFIHPGERTEKTGEGTFSVDLADPASFGTACSSMFSEHGTPTRILHALCLNHEADSGRDKLVDTLDGRQGFIDRAFFSLLHLAQALGQEELAPETELLVATSGAFDVTGPETEDPLCALALGPVLVLPREIPEVRARLFDLPAAIDDEQAARTVVSELASRAENSTAAQRGATRFEETWERTTPGEATFPELPERPVFLFTGGFGGVALTLARDAARSLKARIVLVSRSDLSPKGDDVVEGRMRAVEDLQALGADVLVVKADVASIDAMHQALVDARARFGRIDVAVHTAGTIDDGPLALKSRESARAVLAPKVDGVEALVDAMLEAPPSHLVLVSSTSAALGPPGQIDYVAANAYVNARARRLAARLPETRVLSLGFGVWRESGMAVRSRDKTPRAKAGEPAGHPLLGRRVPRGDGVHEFHALYRVADLWPLSEHRVRGGSAILPGTGMLELVRAAAMFALDLSPGEPLEIRNLTFLAALEVGDDDVREVSVRAVPDAGAPEHAFEVVVESRGPGEDHFTEHARAMVSHCGPSSARNAPIGDLVARCRLRHVEFEEGRQLLPQERELSFGANWKVVRAMDFGEQEAMARLTLPERLAPELATYALHPGVLDMASGFAFSLADVGGTNDRIRVPVSYERVRVFGAVTRTVTSYVRCRQSDEKSGVAVFDVRITDEEGRMLIEINGYATRSIAPSGFRRPAKVSSAPTLLDRWLENGISNEEGAEVFRRALHARSGRTVYATPLSPQALRADLAPARPPATSEESPPSRAPGSLRGGAEGAPRDEIERKLVEMWGALLGAEGIGIKDNFFDLGGHSLIAVRLFSRVKKTWGVELSLAVLFEAPTIEGTAGLIRDALGVELTPVTNGAKPAEPTPDPAARRPRFSPLVKIQQGNGARPFFCVHGAGGNVLNFRSLARGLGVEQTFYGLQAQGVDGAEPLRTIEEMAELYLGEVRRVQPKGPYLIGGYSGGGVVAYEMAQRLLQEGEATSPLVFLDTFHPGTTPRRITVPERLSQLLKEGPSYVTRQLKGKLERRKWKAIVERELQAHADRNEPLPLEVREAKLTDAFVEAARQYRPEPYPGPVVLFRATSVAAVFDHVGPRLGWEALIPDMRIVEVPGDHDSLVLEPNVLILTAHLRETLLGRSAPEDTAGLSLAI